MGDLMMKAIIIAATAHKEQVDKGGNPYIFHCMKVMNSVYEAINKYVTMSDDDKEDYLIVAVMHDVIEDSPHKLEDFIPSGFSRHALEALDAITKRPHETRKEYLKRVKMNEIARFVKIHDLIDNTNLDRLKSITLGDYIRQEQYANEIFYLKSEWED
jgi:(p)ppGpp synthase/HD superfamily hydrolase